MSRGRLDADWLDAVTRHRRKTRELLDAEREHTTFLRNLLALSPYAVRRWHPRRERPYQRPSEARRQT